MSDEGDAAARVEKTFERAVLDRLSAAASEIIQSYREDLTYLANEIRIRSEENLDDLREQDRTDPLDGIWDVSFDAIFTGVGIGGLAVVEEIIRLPEVLGQLASSLPQLWDKGEEILRELSENEDLLEEIYEEFPSIMTAIGEAGLRALTAEIDQLWSEAEAAERAREFRVAQASYVRAVGKVLELASMFKAIIRLVPSLSRQSLGAFDDLAETYARQRQSSRFGDAVAGSRFSPRISGGAVSGALSRRSSDIRQRIRATGRHGSGVLQAMRRNLRLSRRERRRLRDRRNRDRRRREQSGTRLTGNTEFRRRAADQILDQPGHPLEFLIDRTSRDASLLHVNRADGVYNHHQVFSVDAGHVVNRVDGGNLLALQDSAWNVIEGASERARRVIDIQGVPVELDTAVLWREAGLISQEVFSNSVRRTNRIIQNGGQVAWEAVD